MTLPFSTIFFYFMSLNFLLFFDLFPAFLYYSISSNLPSLSGSFYLSTLILHIPVIVLIMYFLFHSHSCLFILSQLLSLSHSLSLFRFLSFLIALLSLPFFLPLTVSHSLPSPQSSPFSSSLPPSHCVTFSSFSP